MVFGGGCSAVLLIVIVREFSWDRQWLELLLIFVAMLGVGVLIFRKGVKGHNRWK